MDLRSLLFVGFLTPGLLLAQSGSFPATRGSAANPAFVAAHNAALRRARVWSAPKTPVAAANLGANGSEPDGFRENAVVECRFKIEGVGGATPKFMCERPNGDDFKVKYGSKNLEVYTEVLATRLFNALGFPADRMYRVARVRCFGCSADPFKDLQCLNEGKSRDACFAKVDYTKYVDFGHAVIERSVAGRRIETDKERGWSWEELSKIDAKAGGASIAEVDALRLMAIFVGHWDNKPKNQRLLCLGEPDLDATARLDSLPCARPVAMVQDLGGTFGPSKLDLKGWSASPIWARATGCLVSMHSYPDGGSSFPDAHISEEGRAFLARLLRQLSVTQIRALFVGANVAAYPRADAAARNVDNWVKAFQAKTDAIVNRPPCPAGP